MSVRTSARPVRVLVMEDHERMRTAMVDAITAADAMDVVAATGSAREALVLIDRHRPDVAVLDVRMPDGDGIDVCRTIQRAHPEIRCVVLTSHEEDGTRRRVLAAGATTFLLKTTRTHELTRAIADAIAD